MSVQDGALEYAPTDDRGCDFCGCRAVASYSAPPISFASTVTHVDGTQLEVASRDDGDWFACRPCERLIEHERYDRLADRAARHAARCARIEVAVAGASRKVSRRFRAEGQAYVREMVAAFAAARGEVTSSAASS
jgi:hypothetical protein